MKPFGTLFSRKTVTALAAFVACEVFVYGYTYYSISWELSAMQGGCTNSWQCQPLFGIELTAMFVSSLFAMFGVVPCLLLGMGVAFGAECWRNRQQMTRYQREFVGNSRFSEPSKTLITGEG